MKKRKEVTIDTDTRLITPYTNKITFGKGLNDKNQK